jgi:hypothetical protein
VCVCDCNLGLNNHKEFCNLGFWVLLVFIRRKKKKKNTVLQELLPLLHDLIDNLKDVVW